jgi:redox-sensitive bicupin YhaK (pirin superfamily)
MIKKIPTEQIYSKNYSWYIARSHFSYGDYVDLQNERFGVLKALNEFIIQPDQGFITHPHTDMEIISYCVEGELSHDDNMGNSNTLRQGDAQYLCAGSGITHSEMNPSGDRSLRFYQIWILPERKGLTPNYDTRNSSAIAVQNQMYQIASGTALGTMKINQDANIYVARLESGKQLRFRIADNRQGYLVCIDGKFSSNDIKMQHRDALKIRGEHDISITALEDSHFLMIEMAGN